ncbi:hypothetical protein GA0070610_5913 [Micromonospora echinofusca]|uniref:Spore-associated protein A n=1 Tax=Micromonospora echinofusca TaxID=47858 RepID=A0A1C5GK93_MICEH|nr:hypothetical protein [Micromonospora echinofusca]SCG19536.1 hypothetical protein GA0070610_5913 [Micromonospora echinofusca]
MYRTIRRTGVVLAVALGLAAGTGAAAQAAVVNPVTPHSLCGLGYGVLDQDPIRHAETGAPLGAVYLLYHPVTGYGCTVTVKSAYVGAATRTQVYLAAQYLPTRTDDGDRFWAAGPTRAYVRGGCIIWGGFMADAGGTIHYHERANPAIGGIGTCF